MTVAEKEEDVELDDKKEQARQQLDQNHLAFKEMI